MEYKYLFSVFLISGDDVRLDVKEIGRILAS